MPAALRVAALCASAQALREAALQGMTGVVPQHGGLPPVGSRADVAGVSADDVMTCFASSEATDLLTEAATLFNVEPLKEFNSTDPQRARRCLRARARLPACYGIRSQRRL